jgi:hypothetical protein
LRINKDVTRQQKSKEKTMQIEKQQTIPSPGNCLSLARRGRRAKDTITKEAK